MVLYKKYEQTFQKMKNLVQQKSNTSTVNYYSSIKIRIISDDDLPVGNILNIRKVLTFTRLIFSNFTCNQNHLDYSR